jgi:segregation and condensation protein A
MAAEPLPSNQKCFTGCPEDEEEGEDPRADLARRLLEYQRFKEAAAALSRRPLLNREVFARPHFLEEDEEEENLEADAFKLLLAFQQILKTLKPEQYHEVAVERLSVTERIYELLEKLKASPQVTFEALFEGQYTKSQCIVTFLALLEMARLKLVKSLSARRCAHPHPVGGRGSADRSRSEFDRVGEETREPGNQGAMSADSLKSIVETIPLP